MKPPDYVATPGRDRLLVCGILSAVVYPATDIIAALRYPGYSLRSQAVSELFAIGAPTSRFVVLLFTISSILLAAYGAGIWLYANDRRSLRWMAMMIAASAIDGVILWNFFPLHMRGAERTFTDAMHLVLAANPFVLLSLVFGAVASRTLLRFYTIATIVLLLITAVLGFAYAPRIDTGPTPWLGVLERTSQYGYEVWQAVFAVALLHKRV